MSIFSPGDVDMEGAYHQTGQCNSSTCHECAIERREMNEPIMIDASDVTVSKIELVACDNCNEDAETHEVILDLRNIGETTSLFRGCSGCCDEYAKRLREGLPPDTLIAP